MTSSKNGVAAKTLRRAAMPARAGALVLALALGLACRGTAPPGDVPAHPTPAWGRTGTLLLRMAPGGGLLLRHDRLTATYAHDASGLRPVGADAWSSGSEVVRCDAQPGPAPNVLRVEPKTGRLLAGTRSVLAQGHVALGLANAPAQDRVALLRAAGKPAASSLVFPTLGGGGVAGPHFVEVMSLPGLARTAGPVALPLTSARAALEICWSPDGRWVVVGDVLHTVLAIVPAGP